LWEIFYKNQDIHSIQINSCLPIHLNLLRRFCDKTDSWEMSDDGVDCKINKKFKIYTTSHPQ
jgi:hypothetical protein